MADGKQKKKKLILITTTQRVINERFGPSTATSMSCGKQKHPSTCADSLGPLCRRAVWPLKLLKPYRHTGHSTDTGANDPGLCWARDDELLSPWYRAGAPEHTKKHKHTHTHKDTLSRNELFNWTAAPRQIMTARLGQNRGHIHLAERVRDTHTDAIRTATALHCVRKC